MDSQIGYMPSEEKKRYGTAERVFALLYFVLGYLLLKAFTGAGAGLGAFVSVLILTVSAAVYFAVRHIRQTAFHFIYLAAAAAFGLVYIISDNGFIKFLVTVFILFALMFYMYFTEGSGRYEFINDMFIFDGIKSLFIMPFSCFASIFPAAFSTNRKTKSGFRAWHILAGLGITVLPTVIVASLLIRADAGFSEVMRKISGFFTSNVSAELLRLIFAVPVAMYFFGGLYANAEGRNRSVLTKEQRKSFLSAISVFPKAAAYAAVTPLCVLYVIFLAVQAEYYFGGFSSSVPAEMTYAEYARSGFFELCAVSVINAVVIIALTVFTKKKEDGKPSVSLKIYSTVLCCFTLLLIAVAISKMAVYIGGYGLTRLRVYTSWFMILLAFSFIYLIIKQFAPRFNFFAVLTATFIVLFGALCFSDVDARIAEYNVNTYLSQKDADVDLDELERLSDSAVPYIEKLTEPKDGDAKSISTAERARAILKSKKENREKDGSIIYFNVPKYRADLVTDKY
jgi:hypothetical protein